MSWKVLGKFRVVRVVAEVMRVLARVRSELTIGFAQNNTQRQSGSPLPQLTVTAACTGHNASSVTLCQTGRAQVQSVTCQGVESVDERGEGGYRRMTTTTTT